MTTSRQQAGRESDQRILNHARKVLWDHEPLRASGSMIEIDVDHGLVRLAGRVRTQALKQLTGYLVLSIPGVEQVENRIVSDPEVVRAVADALAGDPATRPYVIRVDARLGQAKLQGIVPSVDVDRRAVEVALSVPVATGAVSELEIDPSVQEEAAAPQTAEPPRVEVASGE